MPSTPVMRVRFLIEAGTWAAARMTLENKMANLVPGVPYEVLALNTQPAVNSNGRRADIGPPWEFALECQLSVQIP